MTKRSTNVGGVSAHMVEVPPNAARTLEALREMGYDSYAAICDLIDNAIDAGAKKISVNVRALGDSIAIDILDDGKGMSQDQLAEAFRLGSNVENYDASKRLGKYGFGMVTASLSLGRNILVLTRAEGSLGYEGVLDMDTIAKEDRFVIHLKPAKSKDVVETVDHHGTMVRLTKIDRIGDTNVSRFAGNLRQRVGQTYRHFLSNGVNIAVNGRNARRHDPLFLDHPETTLKLDQEFDLGDGHKARLIVVELPDLGTEGDAAAGIAPHNSGFYVIRNSREIIAGDTFGMYRHHHSYSHFRAELRYTGDTTVFHEDIKKSSIHPDDRLIARLRKLTEPLWTESGRMRRENGNVPLKLSHKGSTQLIAAATGTGTELLQRAATPGVTFEEYDPGVKAKPEYYFKSHEGSDGMTIKYNVRHPLVQYVADANNPKASALLDLVTYAMAKGGDQDNIRMVSKCLGELTAPAVNA